MKGDRLVSRSFALFALAILLIALLPAIPLAVTPVKAGTYLTVSQTNLGSSNVLVVTVDDSGIDPDVGPTVYIDIGGTQKIINMSRTVIQSKWIAYIANLTASSTVGGDTASGNAGYADQVNYENTTTVNVPASETAVFASQGNISGTSYTSVWPAVQLFSIGSTVDEVTITYYDRSEDVTVSVGETTVDVVSVDRAGVPPEVPPNATVRITVSDETENIDPTIADNSSNYTLEFFVNGDLLDQLFQNGDVLEIVLTDDDSSDTVSQELKIVENDGVVSVSAANIYYSDDAFTVTVTDADMNLDTEDEDILNLNGTLTYDSSSKGFYMTLEETGENTGVFEGTIYVDLNATLGLSANGSDTLTIMVPPSTSASVTLRYDNDPHYAVYRYSEASFDLATLAAEISFDRDVYTPQQAQTAEVIIHEPDANDDPDKIDTLTLDASLNSYGGLDVNYSTPGGWVVIGNLSLQVDDTSVQLNGSFGVTLVETGKDTGEFKLVMNLTDPDNDGILEGTPDTTVTITYYDAFDDVTVEATASIGAFIGEVSLDRDMYPIAPGEDVVVYVTLTDSDQNVNPYTPDTAEVSVKFYNATGGVVIDDLTLTLTETDVDTGIFTGDFTYKLTESSFTVVADSSKMNPSGWEARDMVNGKVFVNYTEPLAEEGWVSTEARLKARGATLSVNVTSVSMGDAILVTLTEPDMDLDSESADTVMVGYSVDDDFVDNVEFEETGDSTGVFTAEFVVGEDIEVEPGETITFNYTDPATDASYYGTRLVERDLEVDVDVLSHTAVLTLDSDQYGPFSVVTISLYDPDLALVEDSSDPDWPTLRMIRTSVGAYLEDEPAEDVENGTFTWEIQLYLTESGVSGDVEVDYTDDLYVYYIDGADASGTERTVSAHAAVLSEVATVELDKASYLLDEWMTITVTDFDSNTDPEVSDDITLTVYSDTWPVGQDIVLPETDVNTGIFQAKVQLIDELPEPSALEIWVSLGDTITVEYTDTVNPTEEDVTVTATAIVGAVVEYPVPASEPFITDATGGCSKPT